MASFIYFYAKFTEEFLLLTAAGAFTLLAYYCYTWVVKKRRLGAARNQVPAGLVKVYLNQLINEAQFVRTQLFGLAGNIAPDAESGATLFQNISGGRGANRSDNDSSNLAEISPDLLERLKALEHQLAEKESMVININVEKTKLLEELDSVKQNLKTNGGVAPSTGNQDELVQKIKALEERLEEYSLFEDDLANLKRLQQENTQLKKQVEEAASTAASSKPKPSVAPVAAPAPVTTPPVATAPAATPVENTNTSQPTPAEFSGLLDQSAIDALLEGVSAIPPSPQPAPPPVLVSEVEAAPLHPVTSIQAKSKAPVSNDEFEKLVDSVEDSLIKEPAVASAVTPTIDATSASVVPAEATTPAPTQAPVAAAPIATPIAAAPAESLSAQEKSDEELLKEFENLLNS